MYITQRSLNAKIYLSQHLNISVEHLKLELKENVFVLDLFWVLFLFCRFVFYILIVNMFLLLLPGNPVTRDFEVFEHVASGGPGINIHWHNWATPPTQPFMFAKHFCMFNVYANLILVFLNSRTLLEDLQRR